MVTIISETDLASRTGQVVDQVRQGHTHIVASEGEEQVAIVDITDYRLLRATAIYQTLFQRDSASTYQETFLPRGLTQEEVERAVADAGGDAQAGWNRIIAAYFDGDISLGRMAQLLNLSRFELMERFNRLGITLRLGPISIAEAKNEYNAMKS